MKVELRVPIAPYAYINLTGEKEELEEMTRMYNKYSETPVDFNKEVGVWVEYETFTGEKVLYNDEQHKYTDLDGNVLLSGSAYSRKHQKPFDTNLMTMVVGKKYGVDKEIIGEMWSANSKISSSFGTVIHYAMEQWFKHKENGTDKNYHLPKHPFLKTMVESFPLKDEVIKPEIMISDVKNGLVGQCDGFLITGEKQGVIIDYKSDNDISKNLKHHALQLNFYRTILVNHGWDIVGLEIWNYTTEWSKYELEIKDIEL